MSPDDGPHVHLNPGVRGLGPSATLAINERSRALAAEGRRVFKLGLGQSPFPVPDDVVEALRAHAAEKDYLAVRGLQALRDAVAEYHRRTQGMTCSGDEVLIGPGSKELLFLVQLAYHGDLCIPAPSWVSYGPQARIIGRQIDWLRTRAEDDWKLTPADLEEHLEQEADRPRILVLNYPSNPTGVSYTPDELRALAAVAKAHRVVVISDEIYGELHHEGAHVSIARFYPEGTIVSSGLSKWCGAGGWRLGYFVFPKPLRWLLDAMAAVASETYTAVSAPIQYAAVAAYRPTEALPDYLDRSRRVLRVLSDHLVARLRGAGVKVARPDGGFYLFPDFGGHREALAARGVKDAPSLCERLLEDTGVAMLPGSNFGRPKRELITRLAFVDFDGAAALRLAEPDAAYDRAWLDAACGPTVEAIDRVVAWLAH